MRCSFRRRGRQGRVRLRDRDDVAQEHREVRGLLLTYVKMIGRKEITVIDKANVCSNIYGLWRDVWKEKCKQANVELGYMYVDAMTMALVKNPDKFRVISRAEHVRGHHHRSPRRGDRGWAGARWQHQPKGISMFEPVHGSAPSTRAEPDQSDRHILAAKMMLDNLGAGTWARSSRKAVRIDPGPGRVHPGPGRQRQPPAKMGDAVDKRRSAGIERRSGMA